AAASSRGVTACFAPVRAGGRVTDQCLVGRTAVAVGGCIVRECVTTEMRSVVGGFHRRNVGGDTGSFALLELFAAGIATVGHNLQGVLAQDVPGTFGLCCQLLAIIAVLDRVHRHNHLVRVIHAHLHVVADHVL